VQFTVVRRHGRRMCPGTCRHVAADAPGTRANVAHVQRGLLQPRNLNRLWVRSPVKPTCSPHATAADLRDDAPPGAVQRRAGESPGPVDRRLSGANQASTPPAPPETAQQTETRACPPAQECSIRGKSPPGCTPHIPQRRNPGEGERVSSFGVRLLPSLQPRGLTRKTCWRPGSSSLFQLAGSSAFFPDMAPIGREGE